ncbi:Delta(3,5)-Delta(2,4)-dienoyl-CoA isomerase, mitochondrial [Lachnellula willkommii]|uniref:Delta(3,5)-Delta(2,4)-dienoyl-CoA isomerase, mitochondrial n=1 Tax=Lachnellula willkommii TaxID=215461 RepID=A0A559M4H7_9HELO|nr:Delta(3,5)-Delta(2,4)-dienoyl-CoA isomerase, mitochondrial [Lachnellula willkommii]
MWLEYKTIIDTLSLSHDVRAIIVSGAGDRAFCSGLDVQAASQNGVFAEKGLTPTDPARKAVSIKRHVQEFQDCISSAEKCEKPVICVMHGISFGLAIDMSSCADIRICTSDTRFAVKEVDIGLAADIGTLSRLPKIVGSFSWVKDVSLSARIFSGDEALRVGFVSYALPTKQDAIAKALEVAKLLAEKSPIAVQGTKELLNHARDNKLADSLRYTGVWNSAAVQTTDVERAMLSGLKKTRPTFEKL